MGKDNNFDNLFTPIINEHAQQEMQRYAPDLFLEFLVALLFITFLAIMVVLFVVPDSPDYQEMCLEVGFKSYHVREDGSLLCYDKMTDFEVLEVK